MSWKASLSRNLQVLRFFACPESPSSRGVVQWYQTNYHELKILNPTMPLMIRTTENAMPAVTTELDLTIDDLMRYMIQNRKFKNEDGTIAQNRVEAAKRYLQTDWDAIRRERWASPGFDPERPFLDEVNPDWKTDTKIQSDLKPYFQLKNEMENNLKEAQSGPNNEFERGENALLMCQRVDLWCAGPSEVESAVQHLVKLGERFNELEVEMPDYITEFYPGCNDL